MSATDAHINILPASRRSPTQRHMHNYSLPSPFCAPLPSNPRPTRCRSSPALSEFRQAVYIADPSILHGTEEVPAKDGDSMVATHHSSRKSARAIGAALAGTNTMGAALRPVGPYPGLDDNIGISPTAALSPLSTPSMRQKPAGDLSLLSPPLFPFSPSRPSTSPSSSVTGILNRLSVASLASLPFPLPTPPGLGSDAEWEIDPFAAAPYSSTVGGLPPSSKWSPASSTLSFAHQPGPSDAGKRDQGAPEKFKGDRPSPTRLKELLGRLSISRNPTTSGLHFRNQSTSTSRDGVVREKKSKRLDSMMTFDEFIFIGEAEDSDQQVEQEIHNDDSNILGTPTIRPVSRFFATENKDISSIDVDPMRLGGGDLACNYSQVETSSVSASSPTTATGTSPISAQASIPKHIDVDGIAVSQGKSIIASVENAFSGCLYAPAVSLPSTMQTPTKNALPSSSALNLTYTNLRSNQPHTLAIPPSPRTPPPRPPSSLPPPTASRSFLDLDFSSPPELAQHMTFASALAAGVTEMRLQNSLPPSPSSRRAFHPFASPQASSLQMQRSKTAGDTFTPNKPPIPPRSKLRPPPVKIPGPGRQAYRTQIGVSDESSSKLSSPAHSRSPSVASFRTISPLPTPPMHSRSSSINSSAPRHSHSASVASSDFMISPMPTPPPLSPSEFSPLSDPFARPVTPEPRIDVDVLGALISQTGVRTLSRCDGETDSEVGMSLEAIARAHESSDDDSTVCRTTIREFASQEEPRAPPSRLSFYDCSERIYTSDIDDEALSAYSQFSSTYYTLRRRSSSMRRRRPVKRSGSKLKGRMQRRATPASMISVYSQASFCSQDDASSVPTLPSLTGDSIGGHDDPTENDLGEMVFEAPEYAYAFSWDDYVGHGLEGSAIAGRSPARSGADFEANLPLSRRDRRGNSAVNSETSPDDDWRAVLTAQDKSKFKRRTSSNISVVCDPVATALTRPAPTDVSSVATNGSIGDLSTTSTLPTSSPPALLPNRRKRTIRHRVGTAAPSPAHSNLPAGTISVNSRRATPFADMSSPPLKPKDTATQTGSTLRGMKKRVSVFKNLVSFTLALPRSPPSPNFPPVRPPEASPTPFRPLPGSHRLSGLIPLSAVSSSGGTASTSLPSSASSSWTPGLANGHALFLSPTATPSTISTAI